jgi:hypothetical protein
MNISEAVERACEKPTLVEALSWICVWESERIIKQAKKNLVDSDGKGWDTCFKYCIERVMEEYKESSKEELNKAHTYKHPIIGQEAVVPEYGLGRVINFSFGKGKEFIEVKPYVAGYAMCFSPKNVKLVPIKE